MLFLIKEFQSEQLCDTFPDILLESFLFMLVICNITNVRFLVPIIPEVMMEIDKNEEYVKGGNDSISLNTASGDRNVSLTFTKQLLRESYKAVDENSQVGFLLSSKALIQIIANPCVGFLSERYS